MMRFTRIHEDIGKIRRKLHVSLYKWNLLILLTLTPTQGSSEWRYTVPFYVNATINLN